jgi:hypothetical protein
VLLPFDGIVLLPEIVPENGEFFTVKILEVSLLYAKSLNE